MLVVIKVMLLKKFSKVESPQIILNKRKIMLCYLSYVRSHSTANLIQCDEIELNKVV